MLRRLETAAILALLLGGAPAAAREPGAAEILRRSEEVRSPKLDYAVDFTISLIDNRPPHTPQVGSYTMVARGKTRSLAMILEPEGFYGTTLLILGDEYWFAAPRASRAIQLSARQILQGDVSQGDLARADLIAEYEPSLEDGALLDGEPCWKLKLSPRAAAARFSRIDLWVSRDRYLPLRLDCYGLTGSLLKTARYEDYRKTPLGVRSMRLVVENPLEAGRRTTMTFTNLRKVSVSAVDFSPEGMMVFRDAAMAAREARGRPPRPEEILSALSARKRK